MTQPHEASSGDLGPLGPNLTETEFTDLPIECIDCRQQFIWTAGEQKFFSLKGLVNPPKRCKSCKKAKNERIEAAASAADGKRVHFVYQVVCADCGTETTVPFYPSQGRPVLCRSCFKQRSLRSSGAAN